MTGFWKHITNMGKVAAAVGAIGGSALWMDAKFDAQNNNAEDVKQMIEYVSVEQSMMAEDILNIQDTLDKFEAEHHKQGEEIQSITWILRNQENFTSEQLENIIDEMLQKNTPRPYAMESELEYIPIE